MQIKWLGTASVLIKDKNTKILFDPYLKSFNKNLPPFPVEEICDTDAIFITHPHFDHFSDLPKIEQYINCRIYTNRRGIAIAKNKGFYSEIYKEIAVGEKIKVKNLTVEAYSGKHVKFDNRLILSTLKKIINGNFKKGIAVGKLSAEYSAKPHDVFNFLVKSRDKSVYILGSAGADGYTVPDGIDLLIFPYQGRSDMCGYSVKLLKKFSADKIFLDHYDDAFPPISSALDANEFAKIMQKAGKQVIIPQENVWFNFPS